MPRFLVEPSARSWSDAIALTASAACLVHCLVLPLVVAALPAAARFLQIPETFHLIALGLAVPVSMLAMIAGYFQHGAVLPACLGAIGLVLIAVGALAGLTLVLETGVTVAGSLLLALGHLRNWRLRSRPADWRARVG